MRILFLIILGYVMLRLIGNVIRATRNARSNDHGSVHDSSSRTREFTDIKDAEFEDLTPKEKKGEKPEG